MTEPSLLAELVDHMEMADHVAVELIALEADAIAAGPAVDIESANDAWEAIMAAYWTRNDVEDRLRARLLVERLVWYGARALRRAAEHEHKAAA